MTVEDLILALSLMPQTATVVVSTGDACEAEILDVRYDLGEVTITITTEGD